MYESEIEESEVEKSGTGTACAKPFRSDSYVTVIISLNDPLSSFPILIPCLLKRVSKKSTTKTVDQITPFNSSRHPIYIAPQSESFRLSTRTRLVE